MRLAQTTVITTALVAMASSAQAQSVFASQDFDGGATRLVSSSVINQDGGGGDAWGVGSTNAWFQPGVPFGLVDNSVGAVGTSTAFAGDREGVYGVNSNFDNNFFGISDSDDFGADQIASWTFDISGYENLMLRIGMGGISDGDSFGGYGPQTLAFTYSIDGGPSADAFLIASTTDALFSYRPMDDGSVTPSAGILEVSGPGSISKILSDTGATMSTMLYLDKTPASGPGAGMLDTFVTSLAGTGSQLTLTVSGNFAFEVMAFDDIEIAGTVIPEPSTYAAIVGLLGLALVAYRRRR